jgi:hypothetical protein
MREREELVHELLLGTPGLKGRTYPKPNSKREILARKILARLMRQEAPRGFYTRLVAAHIYPTTYLPARLAGSKWGAARGSFIKRKIVFQRLRGTPVAVADRRQVEIAAFMREQLRSQNLKRAIGATEKQFGVRRSTVMKIRSDFQPRKRGPRRVSKLPKKSSIKESN